ncbi:MAG: hypothetical protein SPL08_02515, partial [Pseudomonadota bacterium]|nr:hypothetical protein [Pseudomonadota bacterium]
MRYFLSVLLFIFSFSSEVLAQSEWENFRISFNKALTEGSSGRSEAIEMPFGTISLVSCRTGIKNLSGLAVGVDVQLKSGWILTDIDLKPSSE